MARLKLFATMKKRKILRGRLIDLKRWAKNHRRLFGTFKERKTDRGEEKIDGTRKKR